MRAIICSIFFAILIFISPVIYGLENDSIKSDTLQLKASANKEGKFAPGEFMLEHITDNHEWHIITLGKTQIAIPLPIILYSKVTGWHFFMSYKFNHGIESYKNFEFVHEGVNKGKIIEKTEKGEFLPLDLSITKVVFSLLMSSIFSKFSNISYPPKIINPIKDK